MNVKKLKELIANLPDATLVVVPGGDHSYLSNIRPHKAQALAHGGHMSELSEWAPDSYKEPNDVVIDVFVIE